MKWLGKVAGAILIVFALLGGVWAIFEYLERFALCASTDKRFEMIELKQQKQMEQMEQKQQKELDQIKEKTEQNKILFKMELINLELKQVVDQIESIERVYGVSPKDQIKRAELERLKRKREELLLEKGKTMEKK